jgi:hypothetical protein
VAGDLIPPPSPARRTDPEADPKAAAELEEAVQAAAEAAPGTTTRGPSPFRNRFGFLFGALAGLALCAAGGFALLLGDSRSDGPTLAANWSDWQPDTTQMLDGALQIAQHVGAQYRLDGGGPLAEITTSSLAVNGKEVGVAVQQRDTVLQKLEGEGLIYNLVGGNPDGTVGPGKPTRKRGRLLMREALELALYSFRYLEDVTMVAVLIPLSKAPKVGEQAEQRRAVFYRPGDLLPQVQVPLAETLSAKTPTASTMTKAESGRVDSLTLSNLFLTTLRQLETDKSYLVLVEPDKVE